MCFLCSLLFAVHVIHVIMIAAVFNFSITYFRFKCLFVYVFIAGPSGHFTILHIFEIMCVCAVKSHIEKPNKQQHKHTTEREIEKKKHSSTSIVWRNLFYWACYMYVFHTIIIIFYVFFLSFRIRVHSIFFSHSTIY